MPATNMPPAFLTSDEALAMLSGYYALDAVRRHEVRDLIATLLQQQAADSSSRSEIPANQGERRHRRDDVEPDPQTP